MVADRHQRDVGGKRFGSTSTGVGIPVRAGSAALAGDNTRAVGCGSGCLAGLHVLGGGSESRQAHRGGHVVIGGEERAQRGIQSEVADRGRGGHHIGERGDARVLAVEHHGAGGGFGHAAEQAGGIVDLTEAVELVAHDVEQQAVARLDLANEMHGVGLVEFEHGDVGVQPAAERDPVQQGRDHAAGEVRAGRIGEHLQPEVLQHAGHHTCGGGFAVGAGDQYHAEWQLTERARQETGVDGFGDLAGERAATGVREPRRLADGLADQRGGEGVPGAASLRVHRCRLRDGCLVLGGRLLHGRRPPRVRRFPNCHIPRCHRYTP